jgi:VTC domain
VVLDDVVAELAPVSLEALDERSALRRRVDTKYVVPSERLSELVGRLAGSHDVLEIDGHRRFSYESVYFDTPDLRCFHDHVHGRRPRFKARTRLYGETGVCFFEVKVRLADELVKRQCPYDPGMHGALAEPARRFLGETLREVAGEAPPGDLAPTLSTRYDRITLGAREGGERATIDLAVELRSMDGRSVGLRDGFALMEAKSEEGGGRVDTLLREAGCEPRAISKYRLGVGLLLADDPESARAQPLRNCFA